MPKSRGESSHQVQKSLNFSGRDFRHKESDGNVAHIIKFTILWRVFTYKIKINYRKYCVLSLRPMHPVLLYINDVGLCKYIKRSTF